MRSIIQESKLCYFCGDIRWLEEHHIFGGPNRKWSEKYGLKIYLCKYHHMLVHKDKDMADRCHRLGQTAFERKFGKSAFTTVFGRNYLEQGKHTTHTPKIEI